VTVTHQLLYGALGAILAIATLFLSGYRKSDDTPGLTILKILIGVLCGALFARFFAPLTRKVLWSFDIIADYRDVAPPLGYLFMLIPAAWGVVGELFLGKLRKAISKKIKADLENMEINEITDAEEDEDVIDGNFEEA